MVEAQQQIQLQTRTGAPLSIVLGLTGNIPTAVSFLIGTRPLFWDYEFKVYLKQHRQQITDLQRGD